MINPCLIKVYLNVIQTDSKKGEKTSPELESLTWPYAEPTTLAFFSWQMLMVRCLTLCSSPVLEALGKRGGFLLLTPYSPTSKPQYAQCLMPPSHLTSEAGTRAVGRGFQAPQGHHQ